MLFCVFGFLLYLSFKIRSQKQITTSKATINKVIGGESVYEGFSDVVYIYGDNGGCSGVLIDKQWVLSAAHCTQKNTNLTVLYGQTYLKEFDTTKFVDIYSNNLIKVNDIFFFDYEPSTEINDIALLHLEKPAIVENKYFPQLPDPKTDKHFYNNTKVHYNNDKSKKVKVERQYTTSIGWGCAYTFPTPTGLTISLKEFYETIAPNLLLFMGVLQKIDLPIVAPYTNEDSSEFSIGYTDEQSLTKTLCFGDSGGPVFSKTNPKFLIGIISNSWSGFVIGPATATRVIDYTYKIRQIIKSYKINIL